MQIFISYSSADVQIALKLVAQLRGEDFIVMRDQEFLEGGQPFNTFLEQVLRASDALLLLTTAKSVSSEWVIEELNEARNQGKRIIPIILEKGIEPPFGYRALQRIDMSDDNRWMLNYPGLMSALRRYQEEIEAEKAVIITADDPATIPQIVGNPFVVGIRVGSQMFIGREQIVRSIVQRIGGAGLQSISVVGNRRIGKSSLLHYLLKQHETLFPRKYRWVFVGIDMMSARAAKVDGVMAILRASLLRDLPDDLHQYVWGEQHDGNLMAFEKTMEILREEENVAVVLLLDEWESIQARIDLNGFIDTLRSLGSRELVAMVTFTAHELFDLYETARKFMEKASGTNQNTSTFHGIFRTAYLGLMPSGEWQRIIQTAFQHSGRDVTPRQLDFVHELAGGHPYFVQLAGSLIWQGIDEAWDESQVRNMFKNEARPIFKDIWRIATVEHQQNILQHLLGIKRVESLSDNDLSNGMEKLKLRGVLTESGEVFSKPFADFVAALRE